MSPVILLSNFLLPFSAQFPIFQSVLSLKSKATMRKMLNLSAFLLLFGGLYAQNVGIGQASPVSKLDVNGGLVIGSAYSGVSAAPTDGAIVQGNVGIGTASPAYKLHVIGSVRFE